MSAEGGEVNPLLMDEHLVGNETWWLIITDTETPGTALVEVKVNGDVVKRFLYPTYRIWTLAAHWTEGLAELETTPIADGVMN